MVYVILATETKLSTKEEAKMNKVINYDLGSKILFQIRTIETLSSFMTGFCFEAKILELSISFWTYACTFCFIWPCFCSKLFGLEVKRMATNWKF